MAVVVAGMLLLLIGTGSLIRSLRQDPGGRPAKGGHSLPAAAERSYPIPATLSPGVRDFLRIETSSGVFSVQYHYGHVDPAPNGAYLSNINAPRTAWYIEDQRYGDIDVIAGVLHDNVALVRRGLKMFDFGLKREAPDGSFPGSFGLFHGTAMFLASASPALLVLQNWNQLESRLGPAYVKHLAWEKQRLSLAAHYILRSYWNEPGHIDDRGKEERFFEGAIALDATGVLVRDKWLQHQSHAYALAGAQMTKSNGVWTEYGLGGRCCHDSSYQGIGLNYGTRFLELVHRGHVFRTVRVAVSRGEQWEISRVRGNGTIITAGNTRTSSCSERDQTTRACKTVNLEAIFSSLMRWGVITNDPRFRYTAMRVWALNARAVAAASHS
jgi:hypothetical protein